MGMIVVSYVYYSLNKVRWMVVDQIVGFVSGQLGQLLWRFEIVDCKVVLGEFFSIQVLSLLMSTWPSPLAHRPEPEWNIISFLLLGFLFC